MHKVVVLYPKPDNPEQFKSYYRDKHLPIAKTMPGLRAFSYGYPQTMDGSEPQHFCIFIGEFDSFDALQAAAGSPEGQKTIADIANYSPKGATMLHMESQ
jgi:uncharacterized protein (TIGR02118 family)